MLIPCLYLKKISFFYSNGIYNAKIQGRQFHSCYPEEENKRILKHIPSDISYILLIGAGTGYILKKIQEYQIKTIYVIEPVVNFIQFQKIIIQENQIHALQYIYDFRNLYLILQKYKNKIFIVIHPAYKRFFPFLIEKISAYLTNNTDRKTIYTYYSTWQKNYFKNFKQFPYKIPFLSSSQQFLSKVIFCGSGPTLKEDLEQIQNLQDYTIIAADSSVIPLIQWNMKIDWIISIDPNIGTLFHFYQYKSKLHSIPVLSWLGGRPELNQIFSNVFFFLTSFPFDQILSFYFPKVISLKTPYRDVLGYVISLQKIFSFELHLAGCGIITNQKQYYTKGTGYDFYALTKQTRISSLENYHTRLFYHQSYKIKKHLTKIIEKKSNSTDFPNHPSMNIHSIPIQEIVLILQKHKNQIMTHHPYLKLFYQFLKI